MTLVCIAWGSLIWRPGPLPVSGTWQPDGPALPVEFARQSRDNRMTLVICDESTPVTAFWATLDVANLAAAKEALAAREGIGSGNIAGSVGWWSAGSQSRGNTADLVAAWAHGRDISGAVWTALKPRFGGTTRVPSVAEVVQHLSGLEGAEKEAAKEYVRRAPVQIRTAYRAAIEEALGWRPADQHQ